MRRMSNRDIARRERDRYEAASDMGALVRDTAHLPDNAVEIIRDRLKMAARLTERIAGRVGPRGHGSSWPAMVREWADLLAQEEAKPGERDREQTRIFIQPTARQITQAEAALAWRRYVAGVELQVLNIWIRAQAFRKPWQRSAVAAGFSRETAKRRLARAFFLIAVGLGRDGIRIDEAHR